MPESGNTYRASEGWFDYHLRREHDLPYHSEMIRLEKLGVSFPRAEQGIGIYNTRFATSGFGFKRSNSVSAMSEEDFQLIEFLIENGVDPDDTLTWAALSRKLPDRFEILWYAQQGVEMRVLVKALRSRPGSFPTAFNMVHSDIDSSLIDSLTSDTK